MAKHEVTIGFEGLAPDDGFVDIPDGYKGFHWNGQFSAAEEGWLDANWPGVGGDVVIHGHDAAYAHSTISTTAAVLTSDQKFSLKAGVFARVDLPGHVIFTGFRDGIPVATKDVLLDNDHATNVRFGSAFRHINELTISAQGVAGDVVAFDNLKVVVPNHFGESVTDALLEHAVIVDGHSLDCLF